MYYPDRYHMTKRQGQFLAHKNLVALVYANSKLEGVQMTWAQTQTIMQGVSGVATADILTIMTLKRAWQLVIANEAPYSIAISKQLNAVITTLTSPTPGQFRTGPVTISETDYVPPVQSPTAIATSVHNVLTADNSQTEQLLDLLLLMMRGQFFWDGNKRTAFLTVNYLAIAWGIGLINVSEAQLPTFSQLLGAYYTTNQPAKLKYWLYQNCIHGITWPSS